MDILVKIRDYLKALKTAFSTGSAKVSVVESRQPVRAVTMTIAGATVVKQDMTIGCTKAIFTAKGTSIRFAFGSSSAVTVTAASHLLMIGASQQYTFPSGYWVAAIADGTGTGSLEISELL